MMGAAVLSAVAAFIMAIVDSFCTVNTVNLLTPYGRQPIIQLVFDGLRSPSLATVACILIIISIYFACVAAFTSWNRLYWSFAREGGLPFPRTMSKLCSKDAIPVNSLVVNLVLTLGLGSIQLGSPTALNALTESAIICITTTYSLALSLLLWRGRSYLKPDRWLNLGRFGVVVDSVALIWCIFISIWLCFPLYLPVTTAYMNWACVVFVGLMMVSVGYWFLFRSKIKHI